MMAKLDHYAGGCRMRNVMRRYVDALVGCRLATGGLPCLGRETPYGDRVPITCPNFLPMLSADYHMRSLPAHVQVRERHSVARRRWK